jgi:hypothetical protein
VNDAANDVPENVGDAAGEWVSRKKGQHDFRNGGEKPLWRSRK